MSIKLLPGDVIAQIKSAVVITSLNGVTFGLLQNSLDAGSSKISISIDYARGNCTVEDNGLGILPADFQEDGGLGRHYYTSKYPPQAEHHGRHGISLASLAALSLLSIASHHREYQSHNSLTIHNSKVVARNIPALTEQELLAHPSGTRVAVRDLFGSMPVRVRQRSIEAERLGSAKNFDQLILSTVALLLPWPGEVVLTVRDATSGRVLTLNSQLARHIQTRSIPKSVTCSRMASLLTQASLAEDVEPESWVPLEASSPGISLVGCVSLKPVVTKRVQFIALGVQPLLNESQLNVLHEEVNKVFANSSFGAIEDGVADEPDAPKKTHGFTEKALKIRKGVDRWPMFFLHIKLEGMMERMGADELLDERRATLARITSLLQITAYGFLKKHHFHPKPVHAFQQLETTQAAGSNQLCWSSVAHVGARDKSGRTPRLSSSRHRSTASSRAKGQSAVSPFATWSRLKHSSGSPKKLKRCSSSTSPLISESGDSPEDDTVEAQSSPAWNPLFSKKGQLLRKPFDDEEDASASGGSLSGGGRQSSTPSTDRGSASEDGDNLTWVDPTTKIRALINPRTGFVVKPSSATDEASSLSRIRSTESLPDRRRVPLVPTKPTADTKNQVFEPSEPAIPCVPQMSEYLGHHHNHDCRDLGEVNIDGPNGKISKTLESKISKDALTKAEVIRQVDRKFILVKVFVDSPPDDDRAEEPDRNRYLLALIDQHAADERCRVEELMEGYFVHGDHGMEARVESLAKPLRFDLSAVEGRLLERFREYLRYWGIRCELFRTVDDKGRESGRVTVEIQALPTSIAERCRLEPRLLVELLRTEIWKLNDRPGLATGGAGFAAEDGGGERDWVARFHQCPEGILEMINSRSCRSAIMFNDVLTLEECRDLVQRVSRCAFSFQCAHGRPSMVPLVDLGGGDTFGLGAGQPQEGNRGRLMEDLKKWAKRRSS
ncbi:hypothetical protein B0T14DRAFT_437119 [Immersiella caudata]|uniref:MutL C-terminal dimerisation domain-containing protein n=1 Tax=Immersiella caudata TaxID=314043 RepID=A0AA39WDB8_9PEZI|nr:hypothetical protein B0T14DRAFT_437119 [Immersiella caudata]